MTRKTLPYALGLLGLVVLFAGGCTPQDEAAEPMPADSTQEAGSDIEASMTGLVDIPTRAADEARPSPNASTSQTIGTTVVTITYGRPAVKGRQVFGELEKYGNVWRAGANEATVFHASDDVTINGEALPAGAYAFFVIPNEGEWTLIFNKQAEQWGAFDHDPTQDALRVDVTPETGRQQEWLLYSFEDVTDTSATAVLHWDTVRVPFTVGTGS